MIMEFQIFILNIINTVKKLIGIFHQIYAYISSNTYPLIVLLRNKEVIQWIFGDLLFLLWFEKKNKTVDE